MQKILNLNYEVGREMEQVKFQTTDWQRYLNRKHKGKRDLVLHMENVEPKQKKRRQKVENNAGNVKTNSSPNSHVSLEWEWSVWEWAP